MAIEPKHGPVPSHVLDILQEDASLPICTACGTQYPLGAQTCYICEDPRQFVPATGQSWTTLSTLETTHKNTLLPDQDDSRITLIQTEPGFAIGQTPTLIGTSAGSYLWDCSAFISPQLISHLTSLKVPLKAMAISHPHFFSTSLTWSRALRVPLYINQSDASWFPRQADITPEDRVHFWMGEMELGPGVKLIQCGGHFPGSSILYWDRLSEPPPSPDNLPTKLIPVSGIIFTADTVMVQPTQVGFTFLWSAPNIIPLNPKDVLVIWKKLEHLAFAQATSSWPNRFIREDARRVLKESVERHLGACGWRLERGELVPL